MNDHAPAAACSCCGQHAGHTGGSPPRCRGCLDCNPDRRTYGTTHARPATELESYVDDSGYVRWRPAGPVQPSLFDDRAWS